MFSRLKYNIKVRDFVYKRREKILKQLKKECKHIIEFKEYCKQKQKCIGKLNFPQQDVKKSPTKWFN